MKSGKLFKIKWLISALAVALLHACGPQAGNFSILPDGTAVYQGNVANNKVDVLWVIDNSGSMLTKQQNLATSFDSFTGVFVTKNFDFNFAIVTTDTRATPVGQNGEFQGAPTVITAATPAFSNTFKTNVVVGSFGDPAAKALDAILLALSPAKLAGANTGFLRDSAHLAVVVLSDADDNDSTATVSGTVAFLDSLKPQVYDVVNRTYKRNYTVNAVVVDSSNPANSACPLPWEDGVKFKQLAAATEGSITSICEADFSSGLTSLSKSIAQAITQIPLRRTPLVETIVVKFNGAPVARDSENGWTYVTSGNKIVFNGTAIPENGTSINVDYIPADIIR